VRPMLVLLEVIAPEPREEEAGEDDSAGCRRLLLEILKRAAFDWVLFREDRRPDKKLDATTAATWLFEEKVGHKDDIIRRRERRDLTSFLSICEQLDLDPERTRAMIRNLTQERIRNAGRPPETSRPYDPSAGSALHFHSGMRFDDNDLLLGDLPYCD